jgi:hypothetical protein
MSQEEHSSFIVVSNNHLNDDEKKKITLELLMIIPETCHFIQIGYKDPLQKVFDPCTVVGLVDEEIHWKQLADLNCCLCFHPDLN